jgi:chemotaxis protein MotB
MAMAEEEEQAGIPEWVVTFGDMMSLLLTFFIMLVSLSEIKQKEQYQAMAESFRRRFGHETAALSMMPGRSKPRNARLAKLAVLGRARRADTLRGGDKVKAPVGDYPRVQAIRQAEQATRGGVVYFEEGHADLSEQHKRILQATAQVIGGKPQKVEIRGHTSSRPLASDSPYQDHWDLAYRRCRNVMQFLVKLGIDPQRLRISVAAHNEPLHDGTDPQLQKENPRVEVFMLNELAHQPKGTAEERRLEFPAPGAP